MHPARPILAASAALHAVCSTLTALLGAGMAGVIIAQVFCRYALNNSLFWSEELARMLLVWLTFIGSTVAYRHGAHVGVDTLVRRLPPRFGAVAEGAAHLACLAFFAAMAVFGWRYMQLVSFQTTPALGWPARLPVAAVPVAGAVLCVHALAFLAQGRAKGRP